MKHKYGERPSQEEINLVLEGESEGRVILDTIKQELTEMEVGSWLAYRGRKGMIGSPPIEILAVDVKGEFEFHPRGNTYFVKKVK